MAKYAAKLMPKNARRPGKAVGAKKSISFKPAKLSCKPSKQSQCGFMPQNHATRKNLGNQALRA